MNFDKILEYQKTDQELLNLESEVAKSNERAQFAQAKSNVAYATEQISKLSQEAQDLLADYNKMNTKIDQLKAKLDEFDGIIEGVADMSEADYYIKAVEQIAEEITNLEKSCSASSHKIDELNSNYKKTWEQGTKASEIMKIKKAEYDNVVNTRRPVVAEINAKLESIKADTPIELIEMYLALRQAKVTPAFVEYDPNVGSCGRCFMELPNDTKAKLRKSGDYVECPHCRRILYIPN